MLNNIEVNGKHVDFPFTLNDLGDDFEFDNYVDMGAGTYGMDLKYKGETVAGAYVYADAEKDIDRNSKIVRIEISILDKQIFKISNINCESNIEDVKKYINNIIRYDENGNAVNVEYSNEQYVFNMYFNDEGTIDLIIFIKKGE